MSCRPAVTTLFLLCFCALPVAAQDSNAAESEGLNAYGLPAGGPSSMRLQDYERALFRWLYDRVYIDLHYSEKPELHFAVDKAVRDTGPFIDGEYYGVHPAVRMYYSPEVVRWLANGRKGEVEDGAVIVKEMFKAPAGIYSELRAGLERQFAAGERTGDFDHAYDALLEPLVTSWTVMIKDPAGSKDGWFWAGPGNGATFDDMLASSLDNDEHPLYSGFGLYTCMRCHSSAENEMTFSSLENVKGYPGEPLQFRVDHSWRSVNYLDPDSTNATDKAIFDARDAVGIQSQFPLPPAEVPWIEQIRPWIDHHDPNARNMRTPPTALKDTNEAFVQAYSDTGFAPAPHIQSFPSEYADHVFPGPGGPGATNTSEYEYVTSDNCIGCHGGLGGSPSGVVMFLQTGPNYGEGYNVSEYGEWRWSPMGLAGRDPIFHSQIECEMIILLQDGESPDNPLTASVAATQQAVIDTCLRCHGAMGQRQLWIDGGEGRKLDSGNAVNKHFNLEYYQLTELLAESDPTPEPTKAKVVHPVPEYAGADDYYDYHRYGELAREGISCTICHRIAPGSPEQVAAWVEKLAGNESTKDWLSPDATETERGLAYLFMNNSTGTYERNEHGDELLGPFADVKVKPMQNSLGITPVVAPPAVGAVLDPETKHPVPFTADSQMCGTCHVINLPNIGKKPDPNNVLNAAETVAAFDSYDHSIEQATFLEWQNSIFAAVNEDGTPAETFRSCQDCHMPGGFESPDGKIQIDQIVEQIASIQDTTYPEVASILPPEDLDVPHRDDYRRHELVGLNVFLVEMMEQFPDILGVQPKDEVMTYATTGSELALAGMLRQASKETVKLEIVGTPKMQGGDLVTEVKVTNLSGHRFPSGVAFRRAFLDFQVVQNGVTIWQSGRTNQAGVLVGPDGKRLSTEFLNETQDGNRFASYQPHYQVITQQDQVQIYEELVTNVDYEFTTSFIHRVHHVKDNRLLAQGWKPASYFAPQGKIMEQFMAATDPDGPSVVGGKAEIGEHPLPNGALDTTTGTYAPDPNYVDQDIGSDTILYRVPLSSGDIDPSTLTVHVTMYSQSFMPAWLYQRFSQAAWAKERGYVTPSTDRLYHLATHLDLEGTPMEDWKLKMVSASASVGE